MYNKPNITEKANTHSSIFWIFDTLAKAYLIDFVKSFVEVCCLKLIELIYHSGFTYLDCTICHYFHNARFYQCLVISKSWFINKHEKAYLA